MKRKKKPRPTMNVANGIFIFRTVCVCLKSIGVDHFLIQGTALGAYRDGGFTPTERDIDIGFLQEEFDKHVDEMAKSFTDLEFHVRVVSQPFSRPRALKLKYDKFSKPIKVDLCAYQRFEQSRFCSNNMEPYSIVHPAELLEPPYRNTKLHDMECNLPSPTELYLRREYGPDWTIPKDTNISSSRMYHYRKTNGITNDFLDT